MDANRIRVARSRRRAPLLKSVGASERLSAGYVPPLERSGGTEGSNPVPSTGESNANLSRSTSALNAIRNWHMSDAWFNGPRVGNVAVTGNPETSGLFTLARPLPSGAGAGGSNPLTPL